MKNYNLKYNVLSSSQHIIFLEIHFIFMRLCTVPIRIFYFNILTIRLTTGHKSPLGMRELWPKLVSTRANFIHSPCHCFAVYVSFLAMLSFASKLVANFTSFFELGFEPIIFCQRRHRSQRLFQSYLYIIFNS